MTPPAHSDFIASLDTVINRSQTRKVHIVSRIKWQGAAPDKPGIWRRLHQRIAEVPDRRVGRVERANDDWIRDTRLLGEIHTKTVCAGRDDDFISRIGGFYLRVVIVRGDVYDGGIPNEATGTKQPC